MLECGDPGGVIDVNIVGPVIKLVVSLSGDVSVDSNEGPDEPPLLFAL